MVLTDRGRPIVCDAGPIIHLDELDALDLLEGFGDALIPSAVCQEVERHRPTALTRFPFPFERREPQSVGGEPLAAILQRVGLETADQQALLLARETPGSLLLTDDAGIRLVTDQLGIAVRGTIGIIVRSIRRRTRTPSAVIHMLETLPVQSSLFIRPALLQEIIALVRQEAERTE